VSEILTGRKALAAVEEGRDALAREALLVGTARVAAMRAMRDKGATFGAIGNAFAVTRQRAEQIVNRGRLKHPRIPTPPMPTPEGRRRLLLRLLNVSGKSQVAFARDDVGRDPRTLRGWLSGEAPIPMSLVPRLWTLERLYTALDAPGEKTNSTTLGNTIIAVRSER